MRKQRCPQGRIVHFLHPILNIHQNHLPNKKSIGKQHPYCSITFNGEKQFTRIINKGGAHPEWDEERRFTLYEDNAGVTSDGQKNTPKERLLKLSCYASDPTVDLTEVLTKGEHDVGQHLCKRRIVLET
ncbi:hypothetical protein DFH07DRAFT_42699 [Mycena maculata]|uniref:C2 domain-containing protein n=1 Tax=Mycena maculata TaxID=230809 RepID=A0AAD7IGI5_9AGAR|nr:hypothetical protein DFH07DRAFT_42699 [Mycena maculata]